MARSISSPWIWPAIRDVLNGDRVHQEAALTDGPHPLRPKIVQVNEASEAKRCLIVSDKESLVAVFLTEEARQSLAKVLSGNLNKLNRSLVKLDRWLVTTVMLCSDAKTRPMDKVDVKLAPICIQCSEITYVGAEGCNIFGAPVWVNERREAREVLSTFESTVTLHRRLADGQKLRDLPDCNGEWTLSTAINEVVMRVDADDYATMLHEDRVGSGGAAASSSAARMEEGGRGGGSDDEEDGGAGSDFGLSPDKASQDFQTQQQVATQLETQRHAESMDETEEEEEGGVLERHGKRKILPPTQEASSSPGRGSRGVGPSSSKRPRVVDEEDEDDGGLLGNGLDDHDFQTQPAEVLALTQHTQQDAEEEEEELECVGLTQLDQSSVIDTTQRDVSDDEESVIETGCGGGGGSGGGGQEEHKESGLPRAAAAALATTTKAVVVGSGNGYGTSSQESSLKLRQQEQQQQQQPLIQPPAAAGGSGGAAFNRAAMGGAGGGGSRALSAPPAAALRAQHAKEKAVAPSSSSSSAAAARGAQQPPKRGQATPASGGGVDASRGMTLMSVDKAPRPKASPKELFGGKTTLWAAWGFLRTPEGPGE